MRLTLTGRMVSVPLLTVAFMRSGQPTWICPFFTTRKSLTVIFNKAYNPAAAPPAVPPGWKLKYRLPGFLLKYLYKPVQGIIKLIDCFRISSLLRTIHSSGSFGATNDVLYITQHLKCSKIQQGVN